ncbi:MAG: hypothetical protein KZQ99_12620, partial [Candidatus Thiodiazotropha sp. (ex Dulcina madagascariensis)]|nr:hypothetical protein [Candidatus Thiodiazotropha sp. (ex Dulcina madagascariensis)]
AESQSQKPAPSMIGLPRPEGTTRHEDRKTAIIRHIQRDREAKMGHGVTLTRPRPANQAPSFGGDRLGRSAENNFLLNKRCQALMGGIVQRAFIRHAAHGG